MNQLQVILAEQEVAKENANQLLEAFGAPFTEAGEILASYQTIKVTDEEDFASMAEARDKRLALKKIRTSVENKRKELKADIVKTGRAIDSVAKFVKDTIEPAEEYLESQEKYAERLAKERRSQLVALRGATLQKYVDRPELYKFEDLTDDDFEKLIADLNKQKLEREEAVRIAEEERKKAAEAERKRQAEIEAENAKLKVEAEAREKAAAKERAEAEATLATEREKAAEIQRQKDIELQAEREKLAAIEREKQVEAAREARAKADAEEQQRRALLAPDKEKIVSFANALNVLRSQAPAVKTKEAQELLQQVDTVIAGLSEKIMAKAQSL